LKRIHLQQNKKERENINLEQTEKKNQPEVSEKIEIGRSKGAGDVDGRGGSESINNNEEGNGILLAVPILTLAVSETTAGAAYIWY
jgi:hypothetical protein